MNIPKLSIMVILVIITMFIPFSSIAEEDSAISAGSSSFASGDTTHASADALATVIDGNNVVIAQSMADAKGREISLFSKAYATGKIVHGEGSVTVTGEATQSNVDAITEKIREGLYRVTVTVAGYGYSSDGGASGNTYALAWAVDPDPIQLVLIQPPRPVVQPFFGWIFGKSDAERYYAFKYQIVKHNRLAMADNNTNDTATYKHAIYWRDVILNDYGLNASQFEHKYTLQEVIALDPELVKPANNSK